MRQDAKRLLDQTHESASAERLRAQQREKFASYAARLKPDMLVLDAKSRYQIGINSPGYLESSGVLLKSVRHVGFDRVEIWKLS